MSFEKLLESELLKFQIALDPAQTALLNVYCEELARWNKKINLTSLAGADLVRRLVIEPVWVGLQLKPQGVLLDIGSGNGSPAIPLQVVCLFSKCYLVEARAKRAAFLRHVAAQLKLSGVEVHRARLEEMAPLPEVPQLVTLQAVALTPELMSSIIRIAGPKTTVVWITSVETTLQLVPSRSLKLPITGTKVYLFEVPL